MKLSLVVLSAGKMQGKPILITLTQFLIGRDSQCHLRPTSPLISSRHCSLEKRGEKVFVQDLKSTNGTFVNQIRVVGEQELQNEDLLTLGPITFRIAIEELSLNGKPLAEISDRQVETADDEAASLLLAMQDESDVTSGSTILTKPDLSLGDPKVDTQLGLPAVNNAAGTEAAAAEGKLEKVKKDQANTADAAAAILSKYMRRR